LFKILKILALLLVTSLLLVTASCATGGTVDNTMESEKGRDIYVTGTIELRVTDPPPADVKNAVVLLRNIEVHRVSDNTSNSENTSEWITILDTPSSFDLMDVIGVKKVLGSANVTAGSFTQIRMDVVEVTGETTNGTLYKAEVPGDKLKIVRPFNVGAGTTTILTVDFDGEQSLVTTGSGKFIFKPVVKLSINYANEQEREQEQERERNQQE
jgi:hypothetical protein